MRSATPYKQSQTKLLSNGILRLSATRSNELATVYHPDFEHCSNASNYHINGDYVTKRLNFKSGMIQSTINIDPSCWPTNKGFKYGKELRRKRALEKQERCIQDVP